jgi:hypothetical protein
MPTNYELRAYGAERRAKYTGQQYVLQSSAETRVRVDSRENELDGCTPTPQLKIAQDQNELGHLQQ